MPIGMTASGEMVFPIQCKAIIERERGKVVEQKPAAVEEKAAAKRPEAAAPESSKPAIQPIENSAGNQAPSAAQGLAKVEPAETLPPAPPSTQAAPDPALACKRDEQRLARLRSDPSREETASFQRELSCVRLKAQVQRLFESIASTEPRSPVPAEDTCSRDAERLARLRADPNVEAITKFEQGLGCEQIRPQLRRLRESLGL
jgi:hypothetical protein